MAWRHLTVPNPHGGSQGYAWSSLACSTPSRCIIGGSEGPYQATVLDVTVDGGRSWTTVTAVPADVGGGVDSVSCDSRACWVTAENRTVTSGFLGTSTDGGRTWTVAPDPPGWASRSVTPAQVACSASACLVYGDNLLSGAPGRFPANLVTALAVMSDDGHRWRPVPVPGGGEVDSLTCIPAGRCWALYGAPDGLEHVATSAAPGATWQPVGALRVDPDHLTGFGCADGQTCFLLDDSDTLTASGDGGQTWHPAEPPHDATGSTDFSTDTLGCTPAGTCWVVSSEQQSAWMGTRSP